jgi:LacI family transcriptional regulator
VLIPKRNDENFFWEKPLRGILKAENEIKQFNFRIVNFLFEHYDEEEFIEEANKICH